MIELPPDITFVIQVVSFVIFWQVMRLLLFIPVQNVLDARAERTLGDRARAETVRAQAAARQGEVAAALGEARRQGTREGEAIRRQGEAEEREIVARYRSEAVALLERERAATDVQIAAARGPLKAEAERLAAGVVAKVLGRAA